MHQLNSKIMVQFLGTETISCHHAVATNGKDGNELKLEKIESTFSSFNATPAKITKEIIMVCAL